MPLSTRLKLIFRNWKKNKVYSFTSVVSLIIGFACCNLLVAFVINEWKISKGSPEKDRIFVLQTDNPMTMKTTKEHSSFIISRLPPLLKEKYPEIQSYCRLQQAKQNAEFEAGNFKTNKLIYLHADKNVNEFFNIPLLAGDIKATLSNKGEAAITSGWAKKVFGTTDVLGKSFLYDGKEGKTLQKITSVIDDSYASSFITFNVLLGLNEKKYFGGITFIKLKDKGTSDLLLKKIKKDIKQLPKLGQECQYYLQSLTSYYFDKSETQSRWDFLLKRDKLFMYIGILSALAILLIACFNYINLYLVRIFKSELSNSIHKTLGANGKQLLKQVLLESFLTTLIGFILSILLVIIVMPIFNNIFNAHLSPLFLRDKTLLTFYFFLIIFLTLIPSVYIGIKLKNNIAKKVLYKKRSQSKIVFNNTMVSLQFGFSILLIIAGILYSKQINYITDTANINPSLIEISGADLSTKDFVFYKKQVKKLSHIESATLSSTNLLHPMINRSDKNYSVLSYEMDNEFLKTHNLNLVSGTGFISKTTNKTKQVIVNVAYINKHGIKNPIGKTIPANKIAYTIVGVVQDFHNENFSVKVKPAMIRPFNEKWDNYLQTLQVKIYDGTRQTALVALESLWTNNFPDNTFTYSFINDDFQALHKDHKQLSKIIGFFSMISFLLSAFGIFGITWYSTEQRTKEIGIRRVNGAKVWEILSMLNKNFIKWVAIAFIVACPIAYYTMSKWLENFAYQTELSWWIFALAGVLALSIALLTVSWQSWRAATRNPVEALRYE